MFQEMLLEEAHEAKMKSWLGRGDGRPSLHLGAARGGRGGCKWMKSVSYLRFWDNVRALVMEQIWELWLSIYCLSRSHCGERLENAFT